MVDVVEYAAFGLAIENIPIMNTKLIGNIVLNLVLNCIINKVWFLFIRLTQMSRSHLSTASQQVLKFKYLWSGYSAKADIIHNTRDWR